MARLCQVRCFIGFVEYYQGFRLNFAQICQPVYALMKREKGTNFLWAAEQETAFLVLKTALCSGPNRWLLSKDKTFTLTDASGEKLGAI